ncbi:class I glutamine amidotransferase-like protein [Daedaleopsis nitida]|nr:class I glutamine amidotransferase-like protein [Daedaleopsis nitida]
MNEQVQAIGSSRTPTRIALLTFPAFEPLDAIGPIEALQMLSHTEPLSLSVLAPTLDLQSTALPSGGASVSGPAFGVALAPTHTFTNALASVEAGEEIDVLLIPGGYGARTTPTDGPVVEFVRRVYPHVKYVITVCTGADIAARAGVLDGKRATTNKARWRDVANASPAVKWVRTARYVVDGNCWKSGGVSAGIDVTLAWIKEVFGEEKARNVANRMEYEWRDDRNWDPFAYMFGDGVDA